jgi:hypothetical protein
LRSGCLPQICHADSPCSLTGRGYADAFLGRKRFHHSVGWRHRWLAAEHRRAARGSRLVRDLAVGITGVAIVGVCIGSWSTVAWRDLVRAWIDWPSSKPAGNISADLAPNYETVVLPLAPLYTLLKPIIPRSREEICGSLAEAVRENDLPAPFFIRLLYQESGFRPGAISPTGALGIAQFMPETATDRGLDNPFDPLQAIRASARLLRDLRQKFGNLGLAAAAYNAGSKRVDDWMAKKAQPPQETKDYVRAMTSWPAENWTVAQTGGPAVKLPQRAPCHEVAGLLAWNGPDQIPLPPRNPRAKNLSNPAPVAREPGGLSTKGSDEAQAER